MFLIVSISIPSGIAVGLITVLLTNHLELTRLSIGLGSIDHEAKALCSFWIVLFILYFAYQAGRLRVITVGLSEVLLRVFLIPAVLVTLYFLLIIVTGAVGEIAELFSADGFKTAPTNQGA